MTKKIKIGVLDKEEVLFFYDYFNGHLDSHQYVINVTNTRGKTFTARMIDEDGEDWYTMKLLFDNRYQRIRKDNVRYFEVKQIPD